MPRVRWWASGTLIRTQLKVGLLGELLFMVHPVILGSGKRLFEDEDDRRNLEPVESKTFGTGVASNLPTHERGVRVATP
jgi:dihydrofolate reductase